MAGYVVSPQPGLSFTQLIGPYLSKTWKVSARTVFTKRHNNFKTLLKFQPVADLVKASSFFERIKMLNGDNLT